MGTSPKVGATHFAILAANYLSGVKRQKTALIEWGAQGDFAKIGRLCAGRSAMERLERRSGEPFRVLDVDYYKEAGGAQLLSCLSAGYGRIVLDFGAPGAGHVEFVQCGTQFLIGSLSEWQLDAFWAFNRQHAHKKNRWKTLVAFGSEESRIEAERRLGVAVGRIPLSVDAFAIDYPLMHWFDQLFG
ncbi:MAG: hypothetical protein LBR77_02710 [Lachnospiraceae bacterium]|jgi:hypothetical protein|nr:hypothetical protein [Lachnospiraceae bacterium]